MLFSIVTCTFNRGYIIERLYRSLQRQDFFDFEWVVINDGSNDNTSKLFNIWSQEKNKFKIRYYEQENRGLIRSLNKAISVVEGEYVIKVDSDDYLTDDCLSFFSKKIKDIGGMVYGVGAQRGININTPVKGSWPYLDSKTNYRECTDLERKKYNLDADMCEAWKTDILRKYPFKVWKNEKFAPEQITFFQIALDNYKIRWFSKVVGINEYRVDGLTKGVDKLIRDNPMGYAMMYDHMLSYPLSVNKKMFAALQCDVLSIIGGNKNFICFGKNRVYKYIMFPFAYLWSFRRKKQFSKIDK